MGAKGGVVRLDLQREASVHLDPHNLPGIIGSRPVLQLARLQTDPTVYLFFRVDLESLFFPRFLVAVCLIANLQTHNSDAHTWLVRGWLGAPSAEVTAADVAAAGFAVPTPTTPNS